MHGAGAKPGDKNNNQPATPTTGQGHPPAKATRARSRLREQGKTNDGGFSHLKPEQREALRRYHDEKQGKTQDQLGKTKPPEEDEDARHNNQGTTPRPEKHHQPAQGTKPKTGLQKPGTAKDKSHGHLNQDRRQAMLHHYNEKLKTAKQETGEEDRDNNEYWQLQPDQRVALVRKYYKNLRTNKQKGSGEEIKGARPKETAKQQGIGGDKEYSQPKPEHTQAKPHEHEKLRTAKRQENDEDWYTIEHSQLKQEQRHAAVTKYKEEVRKAKQGAKDINKAKAEVPPQELEGQVAKLLKEEEGTREQEGSREESRSTRKQTKDTRDNNNNGNEGAEHKTADNPSPKTTRDVKKNEYKEYLQETGVLDHITNSFVRLGKEQEKPTDARRYMEEAVSGSQDNKKVITRLKQQNDRLKAKEKEMEADQANLERRLRTLQERGQKEEHKGHPMERLKTHRVNLPTGHPFSQKEEHKGHHRERLQTHRVNLPTGHPFKSNGGNRRPGHKGTDTDGQSQDTRKQGGEKRDEERSRREREGNDRPTM